MKLWGDDSPGSEVLILSYCNAAPPYDNPPSDSVGRMQSHFAFPYKATDRPGTPGVINAFQRTARVRP